MGPATSEGGLFLVDTINVVMTKGVAGIAFEDGGHELHVPGHGLHFHLTIKANARVAKFVRVIRSTSCVDFIFIQWTHLYIGH